MKKFLALVVSLVFGVAFLGTSGGTAQTAPEQSKVKKVEQDKKINAKQIRIHKQKKMLKRKGKAPVA
ncbi:MAG TPA: hypothetical protein PK200_08045 [Spirochaetota bacterium]|nr:hypothetical protein [Spirochaetota bacterium]HQO03648.1 hypothetical protein [Spirochaetota bacterium]HQP48860.1 hypothetical protein [Spirochaetota bacterium]